jgi:hypothetical protein
VKNRRIELLRLDDLKVDYDPENGGYQRKLNTSQVKQAIKTFNMALVDTPLVAKRANGEMYLVDGQPIPFGMIIE